MSAPCWSCRVQVQDDQLEPAVARTRTTYLDGTTPAYSDTEFVKVKICRTCATHVRLASLMPYREDQAR